MTTPTETNAPALNTQVGGDHYKHLSIQPAEFCMANNYDCCAFGIVKYVTRHHSKNGRQDIEKAMHFSDLRQELSNGASLVDRLVSWLRAEPGCGRWRRNNGFTISMEQYIAANLIELPEACALLALEEWLLTGDREHLIDLKISLRRIIEINYSGAAK